MSEIVLTKMDPTILFFRYNNEIRGFCLATALKNATQSPDITRGESLGVIDGLHPHGDIDMDPDNAEMSNGMTRLVDTKHIGGFPGNYLATTAVVGDGLRQIPEGEPVYSAFTGDRTKLEEFMRMLEGEHGNKYFFVQSSVTINEGASPQGHWGAFVTFEWFHPNEWFFFSGERNSKPLVVTSTRLGDFLFTDIGRGLLSNQIQDNFPEGVIVNVPAGNELHPFIIIPRIQLKSIHNHSDTNDSDFKMSVSPTLVTRVNYHKEKAYSSDHHTVQRLTEADYKNDKFCIKIDWRLDEKLEASKGDNGNTVCSQTLAGNHPR